jgi:hypothetical protein
LNRNDSATHIERTGSFALPLSPAEALPLFTAEGERSWVPGWEPQYIHPPHASSAAGTVFRTDHGGEETLWIVLRYEPVEGIAEYGRFTPGSRLGTVRVQCTGEGDSQTRVSVTYALTAVSPSGSEALIAMSIDAFATMLQEWRGLIVRSLLNPDVGST